MVGSAVNLPKIRSAIHLNCHIHQLHFYGDALNQILQFFVGMVEIDGIAFAQMRIADQTYSAPKTSQCRNNYFAIARIKLCL